MVRWTTGDVIGVAFDADSGTLTFYKMVFLERFPLSN